MNKTKLSILEDMLIKKETINSEDSSLRVENTAEELKASITSIESNKLEQETSTKSKNIIPTDKKYWESGHYGFDGKKANFETRIRLIDLVECDVNTEYYVSKSSYIIRGLNKDKEIAENIGVVNGVNNMTFTTGENTSLLAIAVDKIYDDYNEETDQLMICKMSEVDKNWEKGYVDMPSLKYKSEIEGVTGDVKGVVHNKNFAQNVIYTNALNQFQPTAICNYQLKKDKFYIISCDTENTGQKIYINTGTAYGLRNINGWGNKYHLTCDGTRKFWAIQAMDNNIHKKISLVNKSSNNEINNVDGIFVGHTYNLMIEEISAATTEEALEYLATEYVEHKEKSFTISLGNKTLYKGDKIVRKNGKWYFSYIWKIINDFSNLVSEGIVLEGKNRAWISLNNNFKLNDKNTNINGAMSNISKLVDAGQTYAGQVGFTVGLFGNDKRLYIYLEELSNIQTSQEFRDALTELGAYFVLPLEEQEFEAIEDATLISQLDKFLLNLFEYDDITNFDFDNDITFEIEVEKDNLKIINNRLDELEKQNSITSALALEQEV